jgi:hypothetical protein
MGKIKATRKYENSIEFDETHKLWMDANHNPGYAVLIMPSGIDRGLPAKREAEASGPLNGRERRDSLVS